MLDDLQILVDAPFHRRSDSDVTVELLASGLSLHELEERLIGWKDAMGGHEGLIWLREHLQQ
jgi:hypothetical protein